MLLFAWMPRCMVPVSCAGLAICRSKYSLCDASNYKRGFDDDPLTLWPMQHRPAFRLASGTPQGRLFASAYRRVQLRTSASVSGLRVMAGQSEVISAAEITCQEAQKRMQNGWKYLDVRTTGEFEAGHAPGAINVPVLNASPDGLVANSGFTEQVAQQFPDKDASIIVACKMGKRAEKAITLLSPDFKNLAIFSKGFQAWEAKGLPIVK